VLGLIPLLAATGLLSMPVLIAIMAVFGPAEMGYRQAVTPDRLQGRMNATMRSVNRGMIVVGAPVGGALADALSSRQALWIAVTGLVGQAIAISCSRLRQETRSNATETP
jgi:predicted MFS family arabinose efflux permease